MLNQCEIIIDHNDDHSVINDLNNNFQNKTSATKKKRSRNRQQQRSKKAKRINLIRTLELQNLNKRFQSRATRKVLDESNLPYSGLTSDLEDFVNSNQISHRHPYDYSN